MQTPDLTLLERWRRGRDPEAFQELAHRHAGMVYGACKRVLRNEHDAEEVAQDCFARLVRGDVAPPNRSFGAWLHRFATHRAIDRLRSETSRHARETAYTKDKSAVQDPKWDDIREHVDEAIAALPDKLREPVVLHFLEGRTHQEVADAVQVPRPTVTRRISQGVERVRKSLTRKGVTLASGTLAVLLRANAAQAASPALLGELGKMALAGGGSAAAGTAATTATGGLLTLKTVLIGAGTLAIVVTAAVVLNWQEETNSKHPALDNSLKAMKTTVQEPGDTNPPDPAEAMLQQEGGRETQFEKKPERDGGNTPEDRDENVFDLRRGGDAVIAGVVVLPNGEPAVAEEGQIFSARVRLAGGGVNCDTFAGRTGLFRFIHVRPGMGGYIWAASRDSSQISQRIALDVPPEGLHDLRLHLHPAATISGRFVDRANQPVAYARIACRARSDGFGGATRTNERGEFTVKALQADTYAITAIPEDNQQAMSGPSEITVAAGQALSGVQFTFAGYAGVISGRVTDADGDPVDQADVSVAYQGRFRRSCDTSTDEDGRYFVGITQHLNQEYTVNVSAFEGVSPGPRKARVGDRNVDFVLVDEGTLSGRVVHAATGDPVANFRVRIEVIRPSERISRFGGFHEIENEQGRFREHIDNSGDAAIIIRAPGFGETTYTVADVKPAQAITDIVIPVEPAKPLQGIVVDSEGKPVAHARIVRDQVPLQFINDSMMEHLEVVQSDSAGRFSIDSPSPGVTAVTVLHDNFTPKVTELAPATGDRPVTVRLDPGATVSGVVTKGGKPMASAKINLTTNPHTHNRFTRMGATSEEGRYAFRGLPEGEAEVAVCDDNERWSKRSLIMPSKGAVTADINLTAGSASIAGMITLAGNAPPNGNVSVTYSDTIVKPGYYNAQLDHTGGYAHENLPPGDIELSASISVPRTRTIRTLARLEDGRTTHVDIHFAKADAALEGSIDLGGWQARSISASLTVDTGLGVETVGLGDIDPSEGSYHFPKLPPGKARMKAIISVDSAQCTPQYEFELASGMVTRQDIILGTAQITGTVSGDSISPMATGVCIYPEDFDVPLYNQLSMNQIERLPQFAVAGVQDGAYRIPAPPGTYTLVALSWERPRMTNGHPPSEDDVLTNARWVAERVELKEGETLTKDLRIP